MAQLPAAEVRVIDTRLAALACFTDSTRQGRGKLNKVDHRPQPVKKNEEVNENVCQILYIKLTNQLNVLRIEGLSST